MFNLLYSLYYFVQVSYTITCQNNRNRCNINPRPDTDFQYSFSFPELPDVDSSGLENIELDLSPDLAMFFTYLLRFVIFHAVGLCLCWLSTMSFRRSPRR